MKTLRSVATILFGFIVGLTMIRSGVDFLVFSFTTPMLVIVSILCATLAVAAIALGFVFCASSFRAFAELLTISKTHHQHTKESRQGDSLGDKEAQNLP